LGPQKSRQSGQLAFESGGQQVNLRGRQVPLPQRRTASGSRQWPIMFKGRNTTKTDIFRQ